MQSIIALIQIITVFDTIVKMLYSLDVNTDLLSNLLKNFDDNTAKELSSAYCSLLDNSKTARKVFHTVLKRVLANAIDTAKN